MVYKDENITKQIIKIIGEIAQSKIKEKDFLKMNYLDNGLIDSLQVVEMIDNLEKQFKIRFSPEDLQMEKFRTVEGLIEMINKIVKKKS